MNPSDKYEQIKDIKRLNPVELEAMVLHQAQQIKDIAAHLLELQRYMEFKRRPLVVKQDWVGLTEEERKEIWNVGEKKDQAWRALLIQTIRDVETKLKERNT